MKIRTNISQFRVESINNPDDMTIFLGDETEIYVHANDSLIIEDSEKPYEYRYVSAAGQTGRERVKAIAQWRFLVLKQKENLKVI
jgi:hypothetical protein